MPALTATMMAYPPMSTAVTVPYTTDRRMMVSIAHSRYRSTGIASVATKMRLSRLFATGLSCSVTANGKSANPTTTPAARHLSCWRSLPRARTARTTTPMPATSPSRTSPGASSRAALAIAPTIGPPSGANSMSTGADGNRSRACPPPKTELSPAAASPIHSTRSSALAQRPVGRPLGNRMLIRPCTPTGRKNSPDSRMPQSVPDPTGLILKTRWGRPAVVAAGALNVIAAVTAFFAHWDGAPIGLAVSAVGLIFGLLATDARAPRPATTA
jgi:hypothetical protein